MTVICPIIYRVIHIEDREEEDESNRDLLAS